MENIESTIRAYQGVLTGFKFLEPSSFPEEFAQKRFLKKMERPDASRSEARRDQCWSRWLSFDDALPQTVVLPSGEWYRARTYLHSVLRHLPKRSVHDFPKGSEVFSTKGRNSLEARLSVSRWSVTRDCFEVFARGVYEHAGLKRAFRERYRRWFRRARFDLSEKESNRLLWDSFRRESNPSYSIFLWKLERICTFVEGSRFSTVPKNNEKDRPINIEPLGNLMVQRSIGEAIRGALKRALGVDLETLSGTHRLRIQDLSDATIDLQDASDSVSKALCKFLLPPWFMEEITTAASPFVFGLDGSYHQTRKISSMGNGFTFELMTLILTSLCRVLDPKASVFGDDIIISARKAPRLVELLTEVGFVVNKEKSFITGPFRESCGANYHADYGYLESYDFKYPESIHDCAVLFNKAQLLGLWCESFKRLARTLHGFIPSVLQGGPLCDSLISVVDENPADHSKPLPDPRPLSNWFQTGPCDNPRNGKMRQIERAVASRLQYDAHHVRAFIGLRYVPLLRTKTLRHLTPKYHWAKYLAYLSSGMRAKDEISGAGRWTTVVYVSIQGRATRASKILRD